MWKINSEHEWTENTGSQPRNPDITLRHAVWAFSHFCNKIIHYHTFCISFVKLVTDLFILLAFAAFFYLFSFFVIFFRFLLCFVVFLIWWCFLALLLASQDHCNFCYFLLSAMVGLLCLRIVCPESRETEKSIKARGAQTQGFSTLDDTPGQIQQCEEEERKKCQLRDI